jgi:mRNA interferase RelE/StbE
MTYQIEFSKQATKYIRDLQGNIKERIKSKFKEISEDPFRYLEHYEGDYYKIRIGNYRALIDIDFKRKILFVRIFDKRGRIYK